MSSTIARLLSTWFGAGYSPVAPGTAGAVAAVVIAYLLAEYAAWTPMHIGFLGILAIIPGVWAAKVEANNCGCKDPCHIVLDEVSGQWITIAGAASLNWKSWLAAFLLFRLFDIWKPEPVRSLEKLPHGAGIMADDVMAGVYAALVLAIAGWFNFY